MLFKKSKLWSICFTIIIALVIAVPATAQDINDLRKQQNVIQSKIDNIKKEVLKVDQQKKTVVEELEAIETKLNEATYELNYTEAQLKQTQEKLVNITQELNKAEAHVEEQKDILSFRMRKMYMTGPVDYIEVLLGSSCFSDFITRLDMIKCVVNADKQLLQEFKEKQALVEKKKVELEEQQRIIAKHHDTIRAKRARIASYRGDRQRLLAQLENQKREYEQMEDKLAKDSANLRRKILEYESKNQKAYMGTGEFRWPVPSSTHVTSEYGWRLHPIFKTRRFHDGIDIAASTGTTVVASDDGEVIFAGSHGGYGNTIIISHGGGISTQYSHLSKILVSKGKTVLKGDKIGLVGSTGWSTGPHLHFGVIVNGQTISPWNKLR